MNETEGEHGGVARSLGLGACWMAWVRGWLGVWRFGTLRAAGRRLGACLLAVWAGVGLGVGCRPAPRVEPVPTPVVVAEVQEVGAVRGQRGAAYLANVKGRNQLSLSFRVPGIVELIGPGFGVGDWQEGAVVGRGQLLAQLKQSDFLAASNSAAAQANLDRTQYERARRLLAEGAASQQEFDRALAAMRASEAALDLRRQDVLDSRILAPIAGTILKREINAGETVGAGVPVLTLADLSEVEVEVGVPDRLVGLLRVGDPVRMTISVLGNQEFTGQVKEVGVAAREGSRLFRVVVRLPNADGRLRAGMTASVYLDDAAGSTEGVVVPLSALVARGERNLAVFVVSDGIARERRVVTRDIIQSSIVVTEGLKVGERVVVAGAGELYDNALVSEVPASGGGGGGGGGGAGKRPGRETR